MAGFGGLVGEAGLDAALDAIDLADLHGRPAIEVLARIADYIAETADGLDAELLRGALIECVFEAAELSGDSTYEDLEASLQEYLEREGPEGLAESFLLRVTFSKIWMLIEQHVNCRAESNGSAEALMVGVEDVCRTYVRDKFEELKEEARFDSLDWFGRDGRRLVNEIVQDVARRLGAAEEGDLE